MAVTGLTQRITVRERSDAGEVRRLAMQAATRARLGEPAAARVAIIVAELVSNLLKHSVDGGEVLVNAWAPSSGEGAVEMISIDRGPGIADLGKAFEDGFSTAGSSGTGLGAIRRQATEFDVHSAPGAGTAMLARVAGDEYVNRRAAFDVGAVAVPKDGEEVSGDAWAMAEFSGGIQFLVVDGLGHGLLAAEAANAAVRAYDRVKTQPALDSLRTLHEALRGTRGATAAIITVDPQQTRCAGVGNIAATVVTADTMRRLVSMNGTLGREPIRLREFDIPSAPDAVLVMHSDGLGSRWRLDSLPGLGTRDPALIAAVLFRDFARTLDDVTVVVARRRAVPVTEGAAR